MPAAPALVKDWIQQDQFPPDDDDDMLIDPAAGETGACLIASALIASHRIAI
jgi:hypothetical protein